MVSKMLTFILQLIFLPLTSQQKVATDVRYLGCMIDSSLVDTKTNIIVNSAAAKRGAFKHMVGDFSGMTVHLCVTRCWNKRFTLAAMQDRTRCFCAKELTELTNVSEAQCNMRCQGACAQRCGGAAALSVYETGATDITRLFLFPRHFDAVGWKGCYTIPSSSKYTMCKPTGSSGQPNMEELTSGRMHMQLCVAYCDILKVSFAILKSPDTCCCDWDFDTIITSYISWEARFCNLPCAGDESQKCAGKTGRDSYFKVYDVHALSAEIKGFPEVTRENINTSGLFYPIFPRDDNYEVKELTPDVIKYMETNKIRAPRGPVVDADNSGVGVVDVPETQMTTAKKALLIVLAVVGSLVMIAITYFFYQRYKVVIAEMNQNEKASISKFLQGSDDKIQKKQTEKKEKGKNAQNKQKKTQKKQKIKKNNVEWNAVPSSTSGSGTDTSSEAVV